jgi:hypothetical protein
MAHESKAGRSMFVRSSSGPVPRKVDASKVNAPASIAARSTPVVLCVASM